MATKKTEEIVLKEIKVERAVIVIEGKNSVTLEHVTLDATNNKQYLNFEELFETFNNYCYYGIGNKYRHPDPYLLHQLEKRCNNIIHVNNNEDYLTIMNNNLDLLKKELYK